MSKSQAKGFFSHGMAKWGLFMGFLFVLWFGGWFAVARYADDQLEQATRQVADRGVSLDCANRTIIGFPFRLGVRCEQLNIENQQTSARLETGGFRTAAQIYAPGKIIAELDGPLKSEISGIPLEVTWSMMRGFTDAEFSGGFELASLNFADVKAAYAGIDLATGSGALHLRPSPVDDASLDIAGNIIEFDVRAQSRPIVLPATVGFDLVLENGYQALILQRRPLGDLLQNGMRGEIRSAVLTSKAGGQIGVSGPLELHEDGTLSGKLTMGAVDGAAMGAWAGAINGQAQRLVTLVAQLIETIGTDRKFGSLTMKAVDITIERGVARAGIIELGRIPPLG